PQGPAAIAYRIVSADYFRVMDIPHVSGRMFSDPDGPDPPNVVVVSQATAKFFWGDADPIGRTLRRTIDDRILTVIGVVGDVGSRRLDDQSPTVYYPMSRAFPRMDVVVRTTRSPTPLLPAIQQKVREVDRQLTLARIHTMEEWVANSAAEPRLA